MGGRLIARARAPHFLKDIADDAFSAFLTSLLRKASDGIRLSEHIEQADPAMLLQHACSMGLESCLVLGLIPLR